MPGGFRCVAPIPEKLVVSVVPQSQCQVEVHVADRPHREHKFPMTFAQLVSEYSADAAPETCIFVLGIHKSTGGPIEDPH